MGVGNIIVYEVERASTTVLPIIPRWPGCTAWDSAPMSPPQSGHISIAPALQRFGLISARRSCLGSLHQTGKIFSLIFSIYL
jgi:hypothetical protein